MRIVVNDIAANTGGALTVLKDLYNCIRENDRQNEWIFLLSDKLIEETENIRVITLPDIKRSRIKKLHFDLISGRKFINELLPDVVLSMQNTITFGLDIPQIVYIHQPIPFQQEKKFSFFKKSERTLAVYQYLIGPIIKKSVKSSEKVIVQTEWMKNAVIKQCGVAENKVIKIAPNVKSISLRIDEKMFDKSRFFYPTSMVIYKNNECIYEACRILDKEDLKYDVTLTIPEKHSVGGVHCVGRIDYSDVIRFYSQSTLVFPSYIETFGYPLAEARKVGTIILASDCPFAREILDQYENAYFFDPFNPDQLAQLMKKVLMGDIRNKMKEESIVTQHNTWSDVIDQVKIARREFCSQVK